MKALSIKGVRGSTMFMYRVSRKVSRNRQNQIDWIGIEKLWIEASLNVNTRRSVGACLVRQGIATFVIQCTFYFLHFPEIVRTRRHFLNLALTPHLCYRFHRRWVGWESSLFALKSWTRANSLLGSSTLLFLWNLWHCNQFSNKGEGGLKKRMTGEKKKSCCGLVHNFNHLQEALWHATRGGTANLLNFSLQLFSPFFFSFCTSSSFITKVNVSPPFFLSLLLLLPGPRGVWNWGRPQMRFCSCLWSMNQSQSGRGRSTNRCPQVAEQWWVHCCVSCGGPRISRGGGALGIWWELGLAGRAQSGSDRLLVPETPDWLDKVGWQRLTRSPPLNGPSVYLHIAGEESLWELRQFKSST